MNIQDWFPLELTGLISLQSKGPSGVFSSTPGGILWPPDEKRQLTERDLDAGKDCG